MPTLGEELRSLDDAEQSRRLATVERARREHAAFWARWHPFRCTEQGDAEGNAFWHVVDLIDRDRDPDGTRGLFADFMRLPAGTLVVDVASGARPAMLELLLRRCGPLAGYVAIEPAENSVSLRRNFQQGGYGALLEHIAHDFWEPFPAQQIAAIARRRRATSIVTMTYWGATYLPRQEIRSWVSQALTVSDAVYINMLSYGRFQPEVLRQRYIPLLGGLLLRGKIRIHEAYRALAAIQKMIRFGNEFAALMPLWNLAEIEAMLGDLSALGRAERQHMWGQTAFIELRARQLARSVGEVRPDEA